MWTKQNNKKLKRKTDKRKKEIRRNLFNEALCKSPLSMNVFMAFKIIDL